MAFVVIGGHSRNVGKSSVVAGLIAAMPERAWTAVKITQYGHGICSVNGENCGCADEEHGWAITEEQDRSGASDTSRFLVAGARRSLWVRTKQGRLAEAMPDLRRELGLDESHTSKNGLCGAPSSALGDIIIESNSVMRFLRPDVYVTVLDFATADFKESAREYLDLASAIVLHESDRDAPAWRDVSLKPVAGKPVFYIRPPVYVTPELVEFVRQRLAADAAEIAELRGRNQ
jgi:hypothetical protein